MDKSGDELIYGLRPVIEAVNAGREIEKIYIRKNLQGELYKDFFQLIRTNGIPYQFVPVEKLNKLTRKNHQGVIARISPVIYQPLEQLLPAIFEAGEDPLVVILDGITDVRNFGAIARTSECAGVHVLIIPFHGSVTVNSDAMKTSAGALNLVPVCRTPNLLSTARFLKDSGLKLYGASEKASRYYYQVSMDGPAAIILGGEERGVTPDLLNVCDELIKIPLLGTISSLNVSAAASVVIYEAIRQRSKRN